MASFAYIPQIAFNRLHFVLSRTHLSLCSRMAPSATPNMPMPRLLAPHPSMHLISSRPPSAALHTSPARTDRLPLRLASERSKVLESAGGGGVSVFLFVAVEVCLFVLVLILCKGQGGLWFWDWPG
jgi:hypothetical protein